MSVKDAIELVNEETFIAEGEGDYEYADYLREFREKLPVIHRRIAEQLGEEKADSVIWAIANEGVQSIRQAVRGFGDVLRFVNETQVLKLIYDFSKKRKFRYGINERYIAKDLKTYPSLVEEYLRDLREKELIFYKTWKGRTYILPTKKGRAYAEREAGVAKV